MRRNIFIGMGALAALGSAFVATTHCCERLNFLAVMGLLQPGWIGLAPYKPQFAAASFLSLGATLYLALFAPGTGPTATTARTAALTLLTVACGMLIFVIP